MDAVRENTRGQCSCGGKPAEGGNKVVLERLVCCQIPAEEFTLMEYR
jgi:hypothetical protein